MKMKYLRDSPDIMENMCNVKFQRPASNFVSLLDDFRLKELYCDATIACDGKKYAVHQVVLSACSDFFAELFANDGFQNPLLVLQDVSKSHLENILTYIYKGEVEVPRYELPAFMKTAKSLFIKGLANHSTEKNVIGGNFIDNGCEPHFSPPEKVTSRLHFQPDSLNVSKHVTDHLPFEKGHYQYASSLQRVQRDQIINKSSSPSNSARQSLPTTHQNLMVANSEFFSRNLYKPDLAHRFSHKRPHYMIDTPQDLSIPKKSKVFKHMDTEIITKPAIDDVSKEHSTPCLPDNLKDDDAKSCSANTTSSSSISEGTSQNLVVADENTIKKEPLDKEEEQSQNNDNADFTECQRSDCSNDFDEEEAPLHISEDQVDQQPLDYHLVQAESNNNSKSYQQMQPQDYSTSSTLSPEPTFETSSPNSKLREELVHPNNKIVAHRQEPNQGRNYMQREELHSIPHPVIALRESQTHSKAHLAFRGPPPLMKIPDKFSELMVNRQYTRHPHDSPMKDFQINKGNSHLLVSASPTYHSHSNTSNVCFEIHNKQVGSIIVNGGLNISSGLHSAFSPPKHQNTSSIRNNAYGYDDEMPLNLSGFQNTSSTQTNTPVRKNKEDPCLNKIVTNRKKRLRGPKSWEFLVRLLRDPTTNPDLIRWEHETNWVFRLVKPTVIAQRWGRRTDKHASDNLSYENFARGLRYHYATGALEPVSEKSFVYRFGPKAIKLLENYDVNSLPYV